MTELEFINRFEQEKEMYAAWGVYVSEYIQTTLSHELVGSNAVNSFIKIPVKSRVKEIDSLIEKAFLRDKNYNDPYNDITDKVGTRFVVQLNSDIQRISSIIQSNEDWLNSRDRDFEKEMEENPNLFGYQSVHYIVKNIKEITFKNVVISPQTPCEIQIRTLLQHAYSELTHDTVYKTNILVSNTVKRTLAKSMALLEVTSEMFETTSTILGEADMKQQEFLNQLKIIYSEIAPSEYQDRLNYYILNKLEDMVKDIDISEIQSFISENTAIQKSIEKHHSESLFYRQPIILLVYYLIKKSKAQLKKNWPLTDDYIRPLFTDLGLAF